jgi:multiple sugar transport system ATP-binding protein
VTGGNIYFDDQDVTWLKSSARDIAFVFQFFALYSHMTARQNIAFPLQAQKVPKAEIEQRVKDVAHMLKITHLLDMRPGSLSGGDQQRIALARALVRQPAAFLMDEPLGALDAEFRETMRAEIKRLHIQQNATTVYVTHDQIEAMAMGDKIIIMSRAEVQQAGTPAQVYYDPSNLFVARFIGSPGMNLIEGEFHGDTISLPGGSRYAVPAKWQKPLAFTIPMDGKVIIGFRPEAVVVNSEGSLHAGVYADDLHGGYSMLHLEIGDEVAHARVGREYRFPIGTPITFDLDPDMVRFFDPQTEKAIRTDAANGSAA